VLKHMGVKLVLKDNAGAVKKVLAKKKAAVKKKAPKKS